MTQSRFFFETGNGWEKHFYSSTKKHSKFMQSTAFEWLKKMCFFVKKKLAKKKTSPGFFVTPKKCSTKKHPTFGKESQTLKKSKKTKKNSDVSPKNCSWFQPRLLSSFKTSCNLFHSSKLTAWVEKKNVSLQQQTPGLKTPWCFFPSNKPLRLQPVESWWKSLV